MGNLTPCKIVNPENIILKLCIRDYVCEMTHHANFGFNRCSGGEMLPPCDYFFDCRVLSLLFSRSCAQVEPLDRFSRFMAQTTCFRARMVLLGVRMTGDHIWGNMPLKPPKMGVNGQFQAKTAKYKNRNISKTKSDQDQIWGSSWYSQVHFVGGLLWYDNQSPVIYVTHGIRYTSCKQTQTLPYQCCQLLCE